MKKWILILGLITSFNANADDDEYCTDGICTYTCGKTCTATLNLETGLFKVEGSGKMIGPAYKVIDGKNVSGMPWQPHMNDIQTVEISEEITNIGSGFLWGANHVRQVTIPKNVTEIGSWAFLATSITSIDIPNKVEKIDSYAFASTKISEIEIPDSVKKIGNWAFQATSLSEVDIPDNVEYIGYNIFYGSHVQKVYCNNIGGRCDKFFYGKAYDGEAYHSGNLKEGVLQSYYIDADRYVLDGLRYKNYKDMKNNIPVKRIYTIDEANAVSGEVNSVKIRYR